MTNINSLIGTRVCFPVVPRSHKSMLEYGKLIRAISHIIEQLIHQLRRDFGAANFDWTSDRFPALVARQTRDKVLTFIDRFREVPECRAITQVIRPHCENNIDGKSSLAPGCQKQFHKGSGL